MKNQMLVVEKSWDFSIARNLIMTGKPLETYLPSYFVKTDNGHVNSVGYGNNDKYWVIRG
jgi:hypothetical protein